MGRLREDLRALRAVWPLLGVRPGRLLLAAGWGALTLTAAVALAATSAWLIARASQMPPVLDLTVAVVTVRALGIGRGVFRYLDRLASHDVALRGAVTLREQLYARLATGRVDAVAGLRRGEMLRRWGTDVDDVGDLVVRAVLPAAVAVVVGVVTVVALAVLAPPVAAVLGVLLVLSGLLAPALVAHATRAAERDAARARGVVAATAVTVLDGAAELTVAGRLDGTLLRLGDAERDLARRRDAGARPDALAQGVTTLATGAAVTLALPLGAAAQASGELSAVAVAVVVLTPLAAFEGVAALGAAAQHLVRAADAARRLTGLLDDAAHEGTGTRSPDRGDPTVRARGLAVGRPGREPLLAGLHLDLGPGRSVVVRGPNGSGKTTLLLTLAGLLPPVAGEVRVGGVPTGELADGAAPQIVSLTAEDAHLFDTTLLENLRVARGDVTQAQAREALERAGLGAALTRLPDGLDTRVGPGGALLSGGERRRLLVARALVGTAPVLLLDEPDEHLDPPTADALLRDILALGDRGVLVVTHRRTTATQGADQVIELGVAAATRSEAT